MTASCDCSGVRGIARMFGVCRQVNGYLRERYVDCKKVYMYATKKKKKGARVRDHMLFEEEIYQV